MNLPNRHPLRRKIIILTLWTAACLAVPALGTISPFVTPLLVKQSPQAVTPQAYYDNRLPPGGAYNRPAYTVYYQQQNGESRYSGWFPGRLILRRIFRGHW